MAILGNMIAAVPNRYSVVSPQTSVGGTVVRRPASVYSDHRAFLETKPNWFFLRSYTNASGKQSYSNKANLIITKVNA